MGTQKNKTKQSKWCENLGQSPEKTEEEEEEEEEEEGDLVRWDKSHCHSFHFLFSNFFFVFLGTLFLVFMFCPKFS